MALGAIPGALVSGPIVEHGRRLAFMITAWILIVGTGLTLIFNFWALLAGRFIMGVSLGIYFAVCPLFISEISPPSISGTLGSLNQFVLIIAIALSFAMTYILPLAEDPEALTTRRWRIVSMIPIFPGVIQFLLLSIVFRHDTPLYYKKKMIYKTLTKP